MLKGHRHEAPPTMGSNGVVKAPKINAGNYIPFHLHPYVGLLCSSFTMYA